MKINIVKFPDGRIMIGEDVEFELSSDLTSVCVSTFDEPLGKANLNATQLRQLITELTAIYHKMRK